MSRNVAEEGSSRCLVKDPHCALWKRIEHVEYFYRWKLVSDVQRKTGPRVPGRGTLWKNIFQILFVKRSIKKKINKKKQTILKSQFSLTAAKLKKHVTVSEISSKCPSLNSQNRVLTVQHDVLVLHVSLFSEMNRVMIRGARGALQQDL